tara:strand:- start:154 stop:363 length:210 start_codon:yes stop_codon:yes gene_type:complete
MLEEDKITITDASYYKDSDEDGNLIGENVGIKATIDGDTWFVPLVTGNTHYDEIMRQVKAGELTIADAE